MKNIKILLLTAMAVLILASCEDFLKEELEADVSSATYYTTPAGLEAAVNATYTTLKEFWGQERGNHLTVFGTDTYTNGADGAHKFFNTYDNQLNPAAAYVRETWNAFYQGINQANAVVGRASQIQGMDEALKTTRVAEVRFLRALYYFTLVQFYGDVHLSLEETVGVQTAANRTPRGQIYEQAIIPDLEFAIANLPVTQANYGRATKPAAEFLLAKVHLTRGYLADAAKPDDFQKAAQYAHNVINNYDFKLLDDFDDLWDIKNQVNSEMVWTIQNTIDPILNGNGNRAHLYFIMEYDVLPGMTRDIENGRPWKRFMPTDYLLGLWDRDVDSRYFKSFKHVFYANNADNIPKDPAGNPKFAVGDTAIFFPGVEWSDEKVASVPYLVFRPSEYSERRFLSLKKFLDNTRADRQQEPGSRDWVLMRLADAYLVAAEAQFKMGNTDRAAEYINVVRRRAAWPGKEAEMEITGADVTLDFILEERARELAGENHRWFDLTRTGTLVDRVRRYNPKAIGIQDYHILRPIPQDQIDKTSNDYPQNPGY